VHVATLRNSHSIFDKLPRRDAKFLVANYLQGCTNASLILATDSGCECKKAPPPLSFSLSLSLLLKEYASIVAEITGRPLPVAVLSAYLVTDPTFWLCNLSSSPVPVAARSKA
jgi:hypothetical protein